MIKGLVVTKIPKRQEDLIRILKIIGDHTWSMEAITSWCSCDKTDMIFYDYECDCYVWSDQGTKPINPKLTWKEYNQLVSN